MKSKDAIMRAINVDVCNKRGSDDGTAIFTVLCAILNVFIDIRDILVNKETDIK